MNSSLLLIATTAAALILLGSTSSFIQLPLPYRVNRQIEIAEFIPLPGAAAAGTGTRQTGYKIRNKSSTTEATTTTVADIVEEENGQEDNNNNSDNDNDNRTLIEEPYPVGPLDGHAHGVSGDVLIVDEKTIQIHDFDYDGRGPSAYFVLGSLPPIQSENENDTATPTPLPEYVDVDDSMVLIPDDGGICEPLSSYQDKDMTLKIPGSKNVSDFTYLSIYAVQEGHNFGSVSWPNDIVFKKGASILGILECSIKRVEVSNTGKSENAPPTISQAVDQVIDLVDQNTDVLDVLIDAII